MAQIDTSIYGQFQPPKISSPFENAAMMSQLQTGQAQNRLAQMKFAEAEREGVERNMLADTYRQHGRAPDLANRLRDAGLWEQANKEETNAQTRATGASTLKTAELAQEKARVDAALEQKKRAASVLGAMIADPSLTPEKVLQGIQDSDEASPEHKQQLTEMVRRLSPEQIKPWLNEQLLKMQDPKDVYAAGNPKPSITPSSIEEWNGYNAMSPLNQARYLEMKRATQWRDMGGYQAPVMPGNKLGAPVPKTLAPGDLPATRGAQAAAAETGKNMAESAKNLPKIQASAATARTMVQGILDHPGFSTSVGATLRPGFKYIPGTKEADFNSRIGQLQGAAFLEAFNALKGGGQITEVEGTKATVAINRMSTSTSEAEFRSAAKDFLDVVNTAERNAKRGTESGSAQPGKTATTAPQAAIDLLRKNPALGPQFKAKYGYLP